MFNKEESKKLRQEFWIAFGKSFPRKWVLYNTKVKDLSFKFHFEIKFAMVSIDIENNDSEWREHYFEKWESIKGILEESIGKLNFIKDQELPNGKKIARISIEKYDVSIHNKETWQETMLFLKENMEKFEAVWFEFEDYIKS